MNDIGSRIKKCRTDKHLSQNDLARYLEVATKTVYNWESGTKIPDSKKLMDLSRLLQVSADYLLGRTEHKHLPSLISIEDKTYTIQAERNCLELSNQGIAKLMKSLYQSGYEINALIEKLSTIHDENS